MARAPLDKQGTRNWIERTKACIPVDPKYAHFKGLIKSTAKGVYVKDIEGNTYIDFTAQSHNVGHNHPKIRDALKKYIETEKPIGVKTLLAEILKDIAPEGLLNSRVSFSCSGTSAAEKALKIVRSHSGRPLIMTFLGSYHGGSIGTMSLSMSGSELRRGCHLSTGVAYVPYPYCYRCPFGQEYPDCGFECINAINDAFEAIAHPRDIAAFFVEPIQAHGGIVLPPDEYFVKLRKICDEHKILLVSDEVVTGFGRTGKMFGMETWDIEPDVIFMGKPIADGLPLGAVIGSEEIMKHARLLSSMDGNALSCAASLANIDVILRENLMENSLKVGGYMMNRLKEMQEKHNIIGDVRGKGLMLGVELVKDMNGKKPAGKEARKILEKAYHKGLLMLIGGMYHQVFRITPPLNITIEQADEGLKILDSILGEFKI